LLFSAPVGPSDEETADGKPLPKVRVIDRLCYRQEGVGFIHERRSHLFLIDIAGGEARQLTDGDCDNSSASWSPDGTQLLLFLTGTRTAGAYLVMMCMSSRSNMASQGYYVD